ncbi:hypothetical protein ENUP19_0008G0018 [Entamoeba nuttalli]|uniref:Uncharacterized protein n=1 Tax=Entamoeba nuttalli TaxID=412467 RepID=A0ABQ0D7S0_9EUKA
MYGTTNIIRRDRFDSEEETEIVKRDILFSDFIDLLKGINSISEKCSLLSGGTSLTFGNKPLKCFNLVVTKHIDVINELYETIKAFKKNNRLLLSELKEEEERAKREERLEKKREEETKPERRKTRPL